MPGRCEGQTLVAVLEMKFSSEIEGIGMTIALRKGTPFA